MQFGVYYKFIDYSSRNLFRYVKVKFKLCVTLELDTLDSAETSPFVCLSGASTTIPQEQESPANSQSSMDQSTVVALIILAAKV
jgi:hypothetical protein